MKKCIAERSRHIVAACGTLELFASGEGVSSFIGLRQLCATIKRELFMLESRIGIRNAKYSEDENKRVPGSRYEQDQYRTQYRCWACLHFSSKCINPFLNRMACRLFYLNKILQRYPERHQRLRKARGNLPPKLKPPAVVSFSKHIGKCGICSKYFAGDKPNPSERAMGHFIKHRIRQRKKLATYYAFFGVKYDEEHIIDWEE